MKRKLPASVLVMVLLAGAVGAHAASPGDECGGAGFPPPPCPGAALPSPDMVLDRMAWELSLTDEQRTAIRALLVKERDEETALAEKRSHYRRQVRDTGESATFDEAAFRAVAGKLAQAETELLVSRARTRSRINALLTTEQRARAQRHRPPAAGHAPGWAPCPMPLPPWHGQGRHQPDDGDAGSR